MEYFFSSFSDSFPTLTTIINVAMILFVVLGNGESSFGIARFLKLKFTIKVLVALWVMFLLDFDFNKEALFSQISIFAIAAVLIGIGFVTIFGFFGGKND